MRLRLFAVIAAFLSVLPVAADAKVKVNKDFAFPPGRAKIVVFRPDVQVGSFGVGGIDTPNAEWTEQARKNLADQISAQQQATGNDAVFLPEQEGDKAKLVADYQALFRAVAGAVSEHKMNPAAKLPTKKDKFDWTLGPEAARLKDVGGGDYALFVNTHDAYGTAGRKVMQLLVGGMFGAGMKAGIHQSYAALVDLSTGELVWFNLDPASGGDPRTPEGATKRMGQLFKGFPTRTPAAATKTAAK